MNPLLRLNPDKRAKAGEMKDHTWLDSIVVQGEIYVIRRAEEDDRRRKLIVNSKAKDVRRDSEEDMDEDEDAMKPVDEAAVLEDLIPSSDSTSDLASDSKPKLIIPANANLKENAQNPAPGRPNSSFPTSNSAPAVAPGLAPLTSPKRSKR